MLPHTKNFTFLLIRCDSILWGIHHSPLRLGLWRRRRTYTIKIWGLVYVQILVAPPRYPCSNITMANPRRQAAQRTSHGGGKGTTITRKSCRAGPTVKGAGPGKKRPPSAALEALTAEATPNHDSQLADQLPRPSLRKWRPLW